MKVLKGGIQMTPGELRKLRGGACSCGCDVGADAESNSDVGVFGEVCFCGCAGDPIGKSHMQIRASAHFPT